jgi:hypothetical protein
MMNSRLSVWVTESRGVRVILEAEACRHARRREFGFENTDQKHIGTRVLTPVRTEEGHSFFSNVVGERNAWYALLSRDAFEKRALVRTNISKPTCLIAAIYANTALLSNDLRQQRREGILGKLLATEKNNELTCV